MSKKKIVFIINPISGTHSKDEVPNLIEKRLDHELFDYEIQLTGYAGHATEIARNCVERQVDIVVAVGGDGTVNEVARALTHSQTALAIMPCGSGNGLARHLCIPMELKRALDVINACNIEAPETYEVEADDGKHNYKAFLIACANASQYGNNAYIAPGATMKDGEMDVIIMEPFDTFEAPQIAADLFMKTLPSHSKIKTFRTKHLHIHRKQPGAIHYDGDPIMTDPEVDVHIEPLGIRIVTDPDMVEDSGQPNFLLNAFSDFFNNINNVREDIGKQGHRIQVINKLLLRKLKNL